MCLKEIISDTHKEIAGSRTKNRLTVQISYAVQLIMELYSTDYLVLMDYIEDISVINNPENPSDIHLYQVKTKSSDKAYSLSAIINDKWFQKLYENAQKYNPFLGSASVVCNTDVVHSRVEVFHNEKSLLKDFEIDNNILKIKKAIAKDLDLKESEIDLSQFYFIRSNLSVKGHKNEVEHEFEEFLLKKDSELQVATVKSIYRLIYDKLDEKFNNEISEECSDLKEIFEKKGVSGKEIENIVSCGLAVQLPNVDKLFFDFKIDKISEKKEYNTKYRLIKRDMFSNITIFIKLKENLINIIEKANNDGFENMPELLDEVYERACMANAIPISYSEESYIKMLIMILIYKYCYGCVDE